MDKPSENKSASQLLADAAEKMLAYRTMKFDLVYEKGSTKVSGAKLTKAAGEIERPGKLNAVAKAKRRFVSLNVKVTVIGSQAWVRATGLSKDYSLTGGLEHIFADPIIMLTYIADAMELPVVTSKETTKQGEARTWISGSFNPSLISDVVLRGYVEKMGSKPIDVALDREGRIVSVRLRGPFLSEDSADVIRRVDIFGFGAPVRISAPG